MAFGDVDFSTKNIRRRAYKVVPSTGEETVADVADQLASLHRLVRGGGSVLDRVPGLDTTEPIAFEFMALSQGQGEPVELYYTSEDEFNTLGHRLNSLYPDSFEIDTVVLDPGRELVKPVEMTRSEYIDRLRADQLYVPQEEYLKLPEADAGSDEQEADSEPESSPEADSDRDKDQQDDESENRTTDRSEAESLGDKEEGPTIKDSGEIEFHPDTSDEFVPTLDNRIEAETYEELSEAAEEQSSPADQDVNTEATAIQVADETGVEQFSMSEDEMYAVDEGALQNGVRFRLGDGALVYLHPPEEIPDNEPLVKLPGPTLQKDGTVLARPALKYTHPQAVRWYGEEQREKDWMTTLRTATESNPEYEDSRESEDVEPSQTLSNIFIHLNEAKEPIAYQVVFERKPSWENLAESRKGDIRNGELDKSVVDRAVQSLLEDYGNDSEDDGNDLRASEYRRLKMIENKKPGRTFNVNIRAVGITSVNDFSNDPDDPTKPPADEWGRIDHELSDMENMLDPLDGTYYNISGQKAGNEQGWTDGPFTSCDVAERFFRRDIVTKEDESGLAELFSSTTRRPEVVCNPEELSHLTIVPGGGDMAEEAFRSTGTTHEDLAPLTRPRPKIHKQLREGMALGYAFDEDNTPEDQVTALPPEKLSNHWLVAGSSGSGKSLNVLSMMLSLHENAPGPTILVDPKAGNMVRNYAKAHFSRFEDLRDVYVFHVPEVLPVIPFFDIRPLLEQGMSRDNAIQQKADEFHMVMKMIDDNYQTAYVAERVITALIKAGFDAEYGSDAYTLDELYSTAVEMYADRKIPRVSHQPQVGKILANQLEKDDSEFNNTMGAVINRFDNLQEDINLYRMFNQCPEWDKHKGEYVEEPVLDFRQLLDEDAVILFDTGGLVRKESQRAFSMYVLSNLWSVIKSDYQNRPPGDSIDTIPNLIIEEAAPLVSTDLVTNTLIPEAREFNFSLGMVMQFPAQVREAGVDGSYDEVINNVGTKIYGQTQKDRALVNSLVHDDKDREVIKKKIGSLRPGEWIADLPAPEFFEAPPRPFSLKSLDIPAGHPSGAKPLSEKARSKFFKQYDQRVGKTKSLYGISPEPVDGDDDPDGSDEEGFNAGDPDDGGGGDGGSGPLPSMDGAVESATVSESSGDPAPATKKADLEWGAQPSTRQESPPPNSDAGVGTNNSAETQADGGPQTTDATDESAPSITPGGGSEAESNSGPGPGGDTSPDTFKYDPLPEDELSEIVDIDDIENKSDIAAKAASCSECLDGERYYRAIVSLANIAARCGIGISPGELVKYKEGSRPDDLYGDKQGTDRATEVDDISVSSEGHNPSGEGGDNSAGEDTEKSSQNSGSKSNGQDESDISGVGESVMGDGDEKTEASQSDVEDQIATLENQERNLAAQKPTEQAIGEPETAPETGESDDAELELEEPESVEDNDQTTEENDPVDALNSHIDSVQGEEAGSEGAGGSVDASDSEEANPITAEIETPLEEEHHKLSPEDRAQLDIGEDELEFLGLLASAFRGELSDYSLDESMTQIRDRAGEPDVDELQDRGLVESTKVLRRRYYSLTRDGWDLIDRARPGVDFGDYGEKIDHRVGVYYTRRALEQRSGVAQVELYEGLNGETFDVIAYDEAGQIDTAVEVETETNDYESIRRDYKKLSEADGRKMWVVPSRETLTTIWSALEESGHVPELTTRRVQRSLQEYLNDNPQEGLTHVRKYSDLKEVV